MKAKPKDTGKISKVKTKTAEVNAQAVRLKILAEASLAFAAVSQDYQALLDQVVRQVGEALADMCQIRLLSDNGEMLELAALYSLNPEYAESLRALKYFASESSDDPGLAPHVFRSGEPAFVPVITAEQLRASIPPEYWQVYERFAPHSYMIVPLRVQGRSIGVISLTRYLKERPAFTEDDLNLVQDLASRAALIINNTRLFQQVQNELTERKRAEKQIVQMKRLYATLSQVNQTIVRVKDRAELYRSICEVATQFGEFAVAWVGLLNAETGEVTPTAASGADLAHWPFPLANIHEDQFKNGLIAMAIHTLQVVTTEDIATDERVRNLQASFIKEDLHSTALIPFQLRGTTLGIVTLISHEAELFKAQEEMLLLKEMGDDISFALDTIETAAERKRAEEKIKRQNQRLSILREIDLAILAADSMENIVGAALSHVRQLIDCRRASLTLIDWGTNEVVIFAINTVDETPLPPGSRLPLAQFKDVIPTLSQNQTMAFSDLRALADPTPAIQRLLKDGLRSTCSLPLFSQGNLIGIFSMYSEIPGFFDEEKIALGREVANQVAIAIIQNRLVEGLSESEQLFSKAFRSSPVAITITNQRSGKYIEVNDAWSSINGFTAQEAIGHTPMELSVIDNETRQRMIDELKTKGKLANVELALKDKAGNTHTILFSSENVELAGEPCVLSTGIDITARKQAEAEQSRLTERLDLATHAAQIGIWDWDIQKNELVWDDRMYALYGITPDDFGGAYEAWLNGVHPDDRELTNQVSQQAVRGEKEYDMEFRVLWPDGSVHELQANGQVFWDETGKPVRMVGVNYDITESKRTEEQLQFLYDASQQLNRTLDLAEINQVIYDFMSRIAPNDGFVISAFDPESQLITCLAFWMDHKWLDVNAFPPIPLEEEGKGTQSIVIRTGQSMLLNDYQAQMKTAQNSYYVNGDTNEVEAELVPDEQDVTRSALIVPLKNEGRVTGVIQVMSYRLNAFTQNQLKLLESLALHIASAKQNAQLYAKVQTELNERKHAEDALHESEEKFRQIAENINQAFWVAGPDISELVYMSPAYEEIWGRSVQSLYDSPQSFVEAIHPEDRERAHTTLLLEKLGIPFSHEYRIIRPDGSIRWIWDRGFPVMDENGAVLKYIGVAGDITDRKQTEAELRALNAELEFRVAERTTQLNRTNIELEFANRAKDEFLATMSHELRTPLNSILGLSETLLEQIRDPLSAHQQRSLQTIASSGQHLLALINDILDLSKIEAGKFEYHPQLISVQDLCRSSLAFVKEQAARKSILLTYQPAAGTSEIYADPRRLKQILVNLLTNAVKFTPNKGEVILQMQADVEQGRIQFTVIDTGIGIAPENLKKLFQPFVQIDSRLTREYEGTGLGLALVQKLTDLHGGSVSVESEVGKGSRFTINLPIGTALPDQQTVSESGSKLAVSDSVEKSNPLSAEATSRGTILLAEDNAANIMTIGDYLESHGYQIVVARDGLDAIMKAQELQPHIILMDIQMPVLNGFEAISRLRTDSRFESTPIIALTALAMPGDRERCLVAGASEYMSKPVSLKMLLKTIDEMLSQKT